jgi:hypothetical protein
MALLKGVYLGRKIDGTIYYRASFTYKNKHISLGSFEIQEDAHKAYLEAVEIINSDQYIIENFPQKILSFSKYVSIINFRDNGIYFKTPIYLYKKYFEYFLNTDIILKFDVDDLFYFSTHTILKRNNHLFVSDFGMQVSLVSRYGIKEHAVAGRDYIFINGDCWDFRYNNIKIINRYNGVLKSIVSGLDIYKTIIHIKGNYVIGKYKDEINAAIAYNKAADILKANGYIKNFRYNYIEEIDSIEYAARYNAIKISNKIRNFKSNEELRMNNE